MKKPKAFKLSDLDLSEISLVDQGANQHANIAIWKRMGDKDNYKAMSDDQKARMREMMEKGMDEESAYKAVMEATAKGDMALTPEELAKQLEALQGQVTDLTKRAETAETALSALTKSASEAGLDVVDGKIAKRADPEFVEIAGEKIEKALVPASILKALESQAAEIAKLHAKEQEVALAKRGETELPHLAGTALAKGKLLAAVEGDADVLKALKAADAIMAKAAAEVGTAAINEASATFRLNKMASDYSLAKGVTFEKAYADITATADGADLLVQARSEAN
jgi:hypothetical protein